MDAHVSKYLFRELICGVWAQKTRVLVTHQLHLVRSADLVLVMSGGKVVEQGSVNELMERPGGELAALVNTYARTSNESESDAKQDPASSGAAVAGAETMASPSDVATKSATGDVAVAIKDVRFLSHTATHL